MSDQMAPTAVPVETKTAIACRLRHRMGRRGPSPTAGEVEIENISPGAIEIEVTMHPLQYLDLVIRDEAGNLVSAAPHGNIFSPREKPYIFRLEPGEKYTHNVSLLGTVPEEMHLPGTYTVRAVYEYNGLEADSETVEVRIAPQES
jgi:hypothetical protein